jgi:nitric oxide reductase NorD protein
MERLEDKYAICGFSGKGRKNCRFYRIKSFKEKYESTAVKRRIGGLIPNQFTRMGPAIRRASEVLSDEKSKMKLLFILSDGKPNDIDEYEGRYGVEDTRMAIKEAERLNIVPFCLTIDLTGRDYLQRIFGKKNHAVLPSVESLTRKLPELYARIIHSL